MFVDKTKPYFVRLPIEGISDHCEGSTPKKSDSGVIDVYCQNPVTDSVIIADAPELLLHPDMYALCKEHADIVERYFNQS